MGQTYVARRSSARRRLHFSVAAGGVLPRHGNPARAGDALMKGAHLSAVASFMRWRLLGALKGAPGVVVVAGADGFVTDVFYSDEGAAIREATGLTVGVDLSWRSAGMNAVAVALRERRPALVFGGQHRLEVLHPYAGAAEPLVVDGRVAGALALFVPKETFRTSFLKALSAAARGMEEQLGSDTPRALLNWLVLLEWRRFLKGAAPYGVVAPEILASWDRSRGWGVEPERFAFSAPEDEASLRRRRSERACLLEVAAPFVRRLGSEWKASGCTVLLTDPDGVILDLYTTLDSRARQELNLYPGSSCHERYCGTNGWGTPLLVGRAMCVVGAENYAWSAKEWACAGSPIFGPDEKVVGGLSVGVPYPAFQQLLFSLVVSSVREIERRLRERSTALCGA